MATELSQYGLNIIYTGLVPNIENIEKIYNETRPEFDKNKALIEQLTEYYKGNQREGIPETEQSVNEKIIVNYTKLLCDTAVAITFTKPLTYISRKEDEAYKKDVQTISNYIVDEGDHESNLQTATDIAVTGVGYQYCLQQNMEKDPTPYSPFTIGRFKPENTYVVRSYDIGNKVVCSFHIATLGNSEYITAFDNKYKYTFYPEEMYKNDLLPLGETYYKGDKFYITMTAHDLPYNPISEFKTDIYGLSTVADLIGLQDSLNTAISNYDNDVVLKIKQILVIMGCEVDDDTLSNLKTTGVLNLPSSNNSTDKIDAKFVSSQLNESIITYIKDTIERMSMISGCPNQSSSGNAETGLAMEVQNGHTVANFISNKREQAFYKPKREQLGNIITILRRNNMLVSDITENDIEIKFDKNRLASLTDNINNYVQLINNFVDPYDALNVCHIFDDIQGVSQRIKANKKAEELKESNKENATQNSETSNTEVQENTVS